MKKRLRVVLWLASSAALSIILFQSYWVWQGYLTSERNFQQTTKNAVMNSIIAYDLRRLSTVKSKSDAQGDALRQFGPARFKPQAGNFELMLPNSSNRKLGAVVRLIPETTFAPGDTAFIGSTLRTELAKNNIALPFKLYLTDRTPLPPAAAISVVTPNGNKGNIAVIFTGTGKFLFKQNILPGLLSLLLVLLSAGSLWYMAISIRKQMLLNNLKNDFISNITHELRTPVAILKSTNEALLHFGEINNVEKTARYLGINADILDKLDTNIDRLLGIADDETSSIKLRYEPVNIDELVKDIIARFTSDAHITYEPNKNATRLITDSFAIDTLLSNLIDNAIKYNQRYPEINITLTQKTNHWQLQVKDNGIGIRKEFIPLIFDKFYRVSTGELHEVKGYGLGLSYVKQLVTAMKGSVSVKSTPGNGTEFTLQFPLT